MLRGTGEIEELRRREREQGIEPDWEIEAFMKASVRTGKRNNIRTDYTLRLLGLEVSGWVKASQGCVPSEALVSSGSQLSLRAPAAC